MSEEVSKSTRLGKAAQEFNVGVPTIVEFLHKKGIKIDNNPNTKLPSEVYALLVKEYQSEKNVKDLSKKIELEYTQHKTISIADKRPSNEEEFEPELTRDDLFIRNMPPEPEKVSKSKPVEEVKPAAPVTEPVAEPKAEPVAIPDEPAVAEPVKPEQQKPEPTPAPAPEPEPIPVPEPEPAPAAPVAETPVADIKPEVVEPKSEVTAEPVKAETPVQPEPTEIVAASTPADDKITPAEEEKTTEPEEEVTQIGQLKVLGKMDLDSLKRPSRKDKKKKGKTEEPAAEPVATTPAEPEAVVEEVKETKTEIKTPQAETPATPVAETPAEPEKPKETPAEPVVERESNFLKTEVRKLEGVTILGTMKLPEVRKPEPKKPVASSSDDSMKSKKKKRKRIKKPGEETTPQAGQTPRQGGQPGQPQGNAGQPKGKPGMRDKKGSPRREAPKVELSPEDIQKQIKETLQRLSGTGKSKASKHRREKRSMASQQMAEEAQKRVEEQKTIMVAEFVTANELANLMNVQVNQIISTCLSLGLFVSINQRLDAETIVVVADEFGFTVKFVGVEATEGYEDNEEVDAPEDLAPRAPIVTVMGHVDHGKTSLLDHIRHTNVIAGEAGGITQHIGAYEVKLENGKKITFLDTPGHEAFTAMRARGAKITDIVIIVIAADDTVMPQTVEAINHAQAAGVPIVFAINKIDKPNANPDKIREELSKRNILVEDWGGKYQSQEISAKKGVNLDLLLEKVLLEAEMLELKANPNKLASGTILESSLDKGRGYVAKILVQTGTLKQGDMVLAGTTIGKVKAMYNERNQPIKEAGPSTPLLLLGLNAAPQAGDTFKVMHDEREAKSIVAKRQQLQREQGIRTQKHITLDEIGRRIAIGDFKELNIIVKGDVDGSVEALSDSLLKLSTQEVQVNIIHKSVGAVTESDVLLASASNAIIIGFQVRPSQGARKLAEQEQIDIRTYSIIYTAINEIKAAIEGMLSPDIEEKIVCNIEVREVFKITKIGTVAGCMVLDGKIHRNTKIRIIRDGIVVYTGHLGSLKRFKDDVKEVSAGYECGLNIDNFNDIKEKDIIEGYEEVEIKRKL
ncbi:MAG: translation initiation factor IF-2 [Lentimicrobiaceae bacterium]|nr:translation initiation factor IF-2 [Lentimicrobiaceae bacterium]